MVMPQLDVATFPSQIFWLVVTFAVLYLCVHYIILPEIQKCLLMRRSFLSSINDKIIDYENQMQIQKVKYDNGIRDAHSIACDMISDVEIWMKKYQDEQDVLLHEKIRLMLEENQKQIFLFKKGVKDEFESLAFNIAVMYNVKVLGSSFLENDVMLLKLRSTVCDVIKNE